MKVGVNMNPEIVARADRKAASMGLSRSAYITMCVANQQMQEEALERMPELMFMIQNAKALLQDSRAKRLE